MLDAETYLEEISTHSKEAVQDMRDKGKEDAKFCLEKKMKTRIMNFTSAVLRGAQELRDACAIVDALMVQVGLPTNKSHKVGLDLAYNIFNLTLSILQMDELMNDKTATAAPDFEQKRIHKVGCLFCFNVALLVGCL